MYLILGLRRAECQEAGREPVVNVMLLILVLNMPG